MKKKILFSLVLILTVLFSGLNSILAFPQTITGIAQSGDDVALNGYDYLALKYYGSTPVYCTQFHKPTPASQSLTFSQSAWADNVSAGVAAIINKAGSVSISGNAPTNYYYAELAINEFLVDVGACEQSVCAISATRTRGPEETLGSYYSWYTAAMDAYKNYSSGSISLSTTKLSFTKDGDNYVSNKITVTPSSSAVSYSVTTNTGTVVKEGNSFYVKVPASSVTLGSNLNVNVTIKSTKTFAVAMNYTPSNTTYQTVTPAITENKTINLGDKSASGTISKDTVSLKLGKVDEEGKLISGAKLYFQTEEQKKSNQPGTAFTSTTNFYPVNDLKAGKYYLYESEAPNGYKKTDQVIEIVIDNDGKITIDGEVSTTGEVKLSNEKIDTYTIYLGKVDEKGKLISGAKLYFQTEEQKKLNHPGVAFKSATTLSELSNLKAGKYYLYEAEAPEGYNKSDEVIEIIISEDGKITVDGKVSKTAQIKLVNSKTKTVFSKISVVNGKELPGATLQVLDENGDPILDEDGETLYKWVSTEEPHIIEGLPVGKYQLKEIIAPEGYVLSENVVEFEVLGDGSVTEVEMKNDLEVDVPDTLSSRSALLMAISMFDIALGIGILTYVKKNKIEE